MSELAQERAVFFVGNLNGLMEMFGPRVYAGVGGQIAGYLSDRMHRDGRALTFGTHRIPTLKYDEFAQIAQAMPVELVHFFEDLEDLWAIPGLKSWGDVKVTDFLAKLDEVGMPHTYASVREERIWWHEQANERVEAAAALLTDSRSRRTLIARVNAIRRAERAPLMEVAFDGSMEYFNPGNPHASLVPGPDEIYVDVGAAHGDTVARFLEATGGRHRAIYAFEPTAGQYESLARLTERGNIHAFRKAVGAETGSITFYDNASLPFGSNALHASSGVPTTVDCVALDDVVPDCTIIKMDVEGYETRVIDGARGLIARCRPDLAITCYHYPQDLFEILEKVLAIHSYRHVALRHFGPTLYDSVLLFSDRQSFDAAQITH